MLEKLSALSIELDKCDLSHLVVYLWSMPLSRFAVALATVAAAAQAASDATYAKRNRMATRRFLERCCLGALASEQARLAGVALTLAAEWYQREIDEAVARLSIDATAAE